MRPKPIHKDQRKCRCIGRNPARETVHDRIALVLGVYGYSPETHVLYRRELVEWGIVRHTMSSSNEILNARSYYSGSGYSGSGYSGSGYSGSGYSGSGYSGSGHYGIDGPSCYGSSCYAGGHFISFGGFGNGYNGVGGISFVDQFFIGYYSGFEGLVYHGATWFLFSCFFLACIIRFRAKLEYSALFLFSLGKSKRHVDRKFNLLLSLWAPLASAG